MTVYRDKMNQVSFKVQEFEFEALDGQKHEECFSPKEFNLKEFPIDQKRKDKHQKIIKSERSNAEENHFRIAPVVLEHRGLLEQEKHEKELQIQDEVDRRLESLREQAYDEGFKKGLEEGRQEVFAHTKHEVEEKLNAVGDMITVLLGTQQNLLDEYRKEIYTTVKNLAKWVILRELKEDDLYLERLLEKLILEINARSNLLIKVGPSSFSKMPEVLDVVQGKLGKFQNLRVEVDSQLNDWGMIVESDNGIINASFDQQLHAIDKLFESLGVANDAGSRSEEE